MSTINKSEEILINTRLLALSKYEVEIFSLLREMLLVTPLELSRKCNIPRASIYVTLESLRKRGLVLKKKINHKSKWQAQSEGEILKKIDQIRDILQIDINHGKEKTALGRVIVHTGRDAIRKEFFSIFKNRKNERFFGVATTEEEFSGWLGIFSVEEINEANRLIKENNLITDAVFSEGLIEQWFSLGGVKWARDYEGRMATASQVEKKYFNFKAQFFAFREVMYLFSATDEVLIELRHNEIQKMILCMFQFMKDKGETVDVNKRLRELIKQSK